MLREAKIVIKESNQVTVRVMLVIMIAEHQNHKTVRR